MEVRELRFCLLEAHEPCHLGARLGRHAGGRGSVSQLSALGFVSGSPERQGRGHVWSWEVDREISVQPRREGSMR